MFAIAGDNPVPTIRELAPVVVVENDRPEWGLAGRELRFGDLHLNPATVGNPTVSALFNPTDSGILAVLERLEARDNGNQVSFWFALGFISATEWANYTSTAVAEPSDSRIYGGKFSPVPGSACRLGYRNNVVPVNTISGGAFGGFRGSSNSSPSAYTYPVIIAPGFGLVWWGIDPSNGNNTINSVIFNSVQWRERPAEKGLLS